MKDGTPSRTAAWVAAARGLGMALPARARIAEDPYGLAFSSPALSSLVGRTGSVPAWALTPGLGDFVLYMQVRTRVLDDAVRAFVAAGGRQLVLLGAGYDCRALRLEELRESAVFEVDHPDTQRHKLAVLARLGKDSPSRHLRWNFEADPLAELPKALSALGHDPNAPTLTLWEGVTMYLTAEALDASVRMIADYSAPGSRLAMTYLHSRRLAEPTWSTRAIAAVVARAGEPWRSGFDPDELHDWMKARGFGVARDESTADAAARLLPKAYARRVADSTRRVALVARESLAVAHRVTGADPDES